MKSVNKHIFLFLLIYLSTAILHSSNNNFYTNYKPNNASNTEAIFGNLDFNDIKTIPIGSGTINDPYQISSLSELQWLSQNPNQWDKYFIQTTDIDASTTSSWDNGSGWSPIGNNTTPFTGSYDGQGHIISNLFIKRTSTSNIGFFGRIALGGSVKNLGLTNVDIRGASNTGSLVGILLGQWGKISKVSKCFATGSVDGGGSTGGLIGYVTAFSYTDNCYSVCNVKGGWGTGGFVGSAWDSTYNDIVNCYTASVIFQGTSSGKGGVTGQGHVGIIANTFWNTDMQSTSPLGIGINTLQMQTQSTFTNLGWDFSNIWTIDPLVNNGFPILRWQQGPVEKTCVWTGSVNSEWNEPANWDINLVPNSADSVIIPHYNYYNNELIINEILSNPAECKNISLSLGAKITINPEMALIVNNNLYNEGIITVKSSDIGDATLIIKGNRLGNGFENVERYLSENNWHLVTSPISNAITNTFYGLWLKPYDESINDFGNYITIGVLPMPIGQGYAVWADYDTTVNFKGIINSGTLPAINLTLTGFSSGMTGWNLIGNPYPAPIDWNLSQGWVKNNIGSTIYVWNGFQYATWNGSMGTNGGSRYIASGQGFFVQATSQTANIQINSQAQVAEQISFKNNNNQYIKLTVNGNNYSDEHIVMFNENALNTYDHNYDAAKLFGISEAPQLYSIKDYTETAIHCINDLSNINNLFIHFDVDVEGNYVLEFTDNISERDIVVVDKIKDIIINKNEPYSFYANPEDISNRFMIIDMSLNNNIADNTDNVSAKAYFYDNVLTVNIPKDENLISVDVFSTSGAMVFSSNDAKNNLNFLSKGVYFSKINLENQKLFIKFVVSD